MLNFKGTIVQSGLVVTVDTRFDGGRHLRIARGVPDAVVFSCGAPVWWVTFGSDIPPTPNQLVSMMTLSQRSRIYILCADPGWERDWWVEPLSLNEKKEHIIVVMDTFAVPPWYSDVHFRTGLPIELAEEISDRDEPVGATAKRFNITKAQVRECRAKVVK